MPCHGWTRSVLVGLLALAVLLCAPAAGSAAVPGREGYVMAWGTGYGTPDGSPAVRDVQRLLRRLGDDPGPIDGLYGPLTVEAVRRFQQEHALMVDGVIGPQTRGRLVAERKRLRNVKLERKSPARDTPAESVIEPPPLRPAPSPEPSRPTVESATDVAPVVAGVMAGLAVILLLVVTWRLARGRARQARAGPRLGVVSAAVLGAFAIGAASGALFVTEASPDDRAEVRTR
jgi:peptidoglycan hydrolase-like protein with peptidoglycan-binding domain